MFEKELLDFVVNAVRSEEKTKQEKLDERRREQESQDLTIPRTLGAFWAICKTGDLIEPCRRNATHHREREKYHAGKLEEAEKELREKGISLDVYDSNTGTYMNSPNVVCSGAITGVASQQFQPRVDQKLLDNVKNSKAKMLEHREAATQFEQYVSAFSINPDFTLRLSVRDISYFRLGVERH